MEWWLHSSLSTLRVQAHLSDPDRPFTASVEGDRFDERRKRALAEIDGVVAGLTFLDKAEKDHSDDDVSSWHRGKAIQSSGVDPLFNHPNNILHSTPPHGDGLPAYADPSESLHDTPKPNPPTEKMGAASKALTGVRLLRETIEAEFQRLNDVSSKSTSPATRRLRCHFRNSKELAHDGMLVCRDLSEGLPPVTLEEVFAVACVSHAMSQILVGQKRMEETQVLSGLQQWKEGIENLHERSDFDALASEMWPSSYTSSTRPEQFAPGPYFMEGIDLPEGQDNTLHLPPGAAAMGQVSQDAFPADDTRPPATALGGNTLELWANCTPGAYGFSHLRHVDGGYSYVPRNDIDPRELSKFCPPDQPIPGYNPPPFYHSPWEGWPPAPAHPSPRCQTPMPSLPSTSSPSCSRRLYRFPVTDEVSDCKATNLRNTITFLAVEVFASDSGQGFYLLSGSGMTAARSRTGSGGANERSKVERRLRREFFDPLKKTGADDDEFLALLAVAKKFVVLGLFGTKVEVQDYLVAISKEILTGGNRQPKFIRWIFGESSDSMKACDNKPTHQRGPGQQSKRREPPERHVDENGPAKKKQRVYRCEECGHEVRSVSGLSKHKKTHNAQAEIFPCSICGRNSRRRDLARQHFTLQHPEEAVPSYLEERRRGYR